MTKIHEHGYPRPRRPTSATQRVTYAYDAYNRLVTRTLDADGDGPVAASVSNYLHDGNQIVLEFDGSEAADLAHRYLWGPAVDQILADEQLTSPGTPGTVLWPLADNLGTVRDLAQYDSQTDTTTVANHRVYDAFGELQSETNPAVDHLFAYTARLFDDATGLQWNLNRWYDAAAGRWLSRDPIGFEAGDGNLYRYVRNGPTAWTDPDGLELLPPVSDAAYAEHMQTYAEYMQWTAAMAAPVNGQGPAGDGTLILGFLESILPDNTYTHYLVHPSTMDTELYIASVALWGVSGTLLGGVAGIGTGIAAGWLVGSGTVGSMAGGLAGGVMGSLVGGFYGGGGGEWGSAIGAVGGGALGSCLGSIAAASMPPLRPDWIPPPDPPPDAPIVRPPHPPGAQQPHPSVQQAA